MSLLALDVPALAKAIAEVARRDPDVRREFITALGLDAPAGQLVTVREYARRHAIGESTVRRHIAEGRLVVERVGGSVRIPANATAAPSGADNALAKAERKLGLGRDPGRG